MLLSRILSFKKVSTLNFLLLHLQKGRTNQVVANKIIKLNRRCVSNSTHYGQNHQISEEVNTEAGALTTGQKVKQAGKDASYMGIIVFGFAVTGALVWYVGSELLFGFSSNAVYSRALNVVKNDERVQYEVGDHFKAYGEETSRGRRRHVSHQEYVVDGVNYMRVQFYVAGNKRKATVHVDAVQTSRMNFDFRYIFVEMQGLPLSDPIIVLDNR